MGVRSPVNVSVRLSCFVTIACFSFPTCSPRFKYILHRCSNSVSRTGLETPDGYCCKSRMVCPMTQSTVGLLLTSAGENAVRSSKTDPKRLDSIIDEYGLSLQIQNLPHFEYKSVKLAIVRDIFTTVTAARMTPPCVIIIVNNLE